MSKTIEQRHGPDGIAKAGELIQIRGTDALTLHDRRVLNLLYERAGQHICDDVEHVIALSSLRGKHKGGERVKDSILRLMQTIVEVRTLGANGKAATRLVPILSDTTISDDDEDPSGQAVYSFSKGMRAVLLESKHWGRVRGEIMFAFSSKYSLALYELLCMRVNLKYKWDEQFELHDFRQLLGVPAGKLERAPNLIKWAIEPAVEEVNALADFGVKINPIRRGGRQRGELVGFHVTWWAKQIPELQASFAELGRPKVGRRARIRGTVERIEPGFSLLPLKQLDGK